ncbi:serine hydrolase domain-containing protein [Streptosporangium sp. NPDC050855]|uniref:serine hydrolase domain-containing protein n=1 Tax=Streptosporangium sp. NPDC050855 TaxID=3366194 RepID=UPI003788467A
MSISRHLRRPAVATAAVLAVTAWAVPAAALPGTAAPGPALAAAPAAHAAPTPGATRTGRAATTTKGTVKKRATGRAGAGKIKAAPGSLDLVNPSATPVTLTSAPRALSVTYTHEGRQHTLADFLERTGTNGFVVLDRQKIVYERYVSADRDTRFQSWSVAKSFTSAAVGIALHERLISSIDDPVTTYLPELRGSGYEGVSIRNLLRMSSGIEWDERTDVPRVQVAANQGRPVARIAARQVRGWEPGSRFEYTSMNSFVLAKLVSTVSGVPFHRYVQEKIWKPAGMEFTLGVGNDGNGDNLGYCCFHATDRDFARFGLLYLNDGMAKGSQVVPSSWVDLSTRPSASFNAGYGLHWWLGGDGGDDFMAAGFGGQYIYVSPEHDVVIVKSVASNAENDQREAVTAFRAVAAEVARTRP